MLKMSWTVWYFSYSVNILTLAAYISNSTKKWNDSNFVTLAAIQSTINFISQGISIGGLFFMIFPVYGIAV